MLLRDTADQFIVMNHVHDFDMMKMTLHIYDEIIKQSHNDDYDEFIFMVPCFLLLLVATTTTVMVEVVVQLQLQLPLQQF